MVLDKGEPAPLPIPDFSDRTINVAFAAVWSTMPDMLSCAKGILDSLEAEERGQPHGKDNPLRQVHSILAHRFPVTNDTVN